MVSAIGVTKWLYSVETVGDLLLQVVDATFKQVFKEAGTNVVYDYLENRFHLNRGEIGKKLDVFSTCLESLLGSAALMVEKLILKDFVQQTGARIRGEERL